MDNIILGILFLSNRTIYQLRERFNSGLNLMYSSSMGGIQAAIKKLLQCEYISFEEIVEKGKYKKIYCLTDSGRRKFNEWINSPIQVQHSKNPELAKLFFMGFSEKESREAIIQEHLKYLNEQYFALNLICEEAKNMNIPDNYKDIILYQLAAARYGRDLMKFNVEWYETLLQETRRGNL